MILQDKFNKASGNLNVTQISQKGGDIFFEEITNHNKKGVLKSLFEEIMSLV